MRSGQSRGHSKFRKHKLLHWAANIQHNSGPVEIQNQQYQNLKTFTKYLEIQYYMKFTIIPNVMQTKHRF